MKLGSNCLILAGFIITSLNLSAHRVTIGDLTDEELNQILGDKTYLQATQDKFKAARLKSYCDSALKELPECIEEVQVMEDVFGDAGLNSIMQGCYPKAIDSIFGFEVKIDPTISHAKHGHFHDHYLYQYDSKDPADQYKHRHEFTETDRIVAKQDAMRNTTNDILNQTPSVTTSVSNSVNGEVSGNALATEVSIGFDRTTGKSITEKRITEAGKTAIIKSGEDAYNNPALAKREPSGVCFENRVKCQIPPADTPLTNEYYDPTSQPRNEIEKQEREKQAAAAKKEAAEKAAEEKRKQDEEAERRRREEENNRKPTKAPEVKTPDPAKRPVTVNYQPDRDEYIVSVDPELEGAFQAAQYRACVDQKVRQQLSAPKRIDPTYESKSDKPIIPIKTDEMITRYDERFEELDLDDRKCGDLPLVNILGQQDFQTCQGLKQHLWTTEDPHAIDTTDILDRLPKSDREKRIKELESLGLGKGVISPDKFDPNQHPGGIIHKPHDPFDDFKEIDDIKLP